MDCIKNDIYRTNGMLQRQAKVFRYITAKEEKCLTWILRYLDYTKYNKINTGVSHVIKQISYKNDAKENFFKCIGYPKFSQNIASYEGKLLEHILRYLHSTKYNEINMCHLDVPRPN